MMRPLLFRCNGLQALHPKQFHHEIFFYFIVSRRIVLVPPDCLLALPPVSIMLSPLLSPRISVVSVIFLMKLQSWLFLLKISINMHQTVTDTEIMRLA